MDLAALDIKIGADLTKLQKDLNSAGVIVDDFAKDLASIGANSAAAAGGMSQVATGATKISAAFKTIPSSVHVLDQSLDSFANEFNQKWSKVVDEAQKLPVVIDDSSEAAKRLQRQFASFGNLSPFKGPSEDLKKFSLSTKDIPSKLQATGKASSEATLALGNLGRVAQDLPFGFIGIANNLNPLLEGFQRLQVSAKATGTSVSSLLVKSLTGAGGLGLALSVVTSALTFASFGLSAWTRGFGQAKDSVDELKTSQDALNKALITDGFKKAVETVNELRVNIDIAKQGFLDKDEVTKQYNETIGKTIGQVTNLNEAEAALNKNADNYIKFTLLKAAANAAFDEASKKAVERQVELNNILSSKSFLTTAQEGFEDALKANVEYQKTLKQSISELAEFGKASDETQQKLEGLKEEIRAGLINPKAQKEIDNLEQIGKDFQTQAAELAKRLNFNFFDPDKTGATKKNVESIADVLAKLKLELSALSIREFQEGLNLSSEKITEIEGVIKKLIVDFKVNPDDTIINKLFGDIKDIRFSAANFKEFIQGIEKSLPAETAPEIPVKINPVFDRAGFEDIVNRARIQFEADKFNIELPVNFQFANVNELNEIVSQINAASTSLNNLNASIAQVVQSGLQDFFTSIGESLAGQENPFAAFADIMADGLKSIGQALIQYGIQVGIIQKVLANPLNPISPALAIAAGIALTAIGSALKNSLKITGLAEGGIIPPGYPNDTYLARLSSNEAVIPLDKGLGKYLNQTGEPILIIPEARISGNDIVISYERTQRKNKRTF